MGSEQSHELHKNASDAAAKIEVRVFVCEAYICVACMHVHAHVGLCMCLCLCACMCVCVCACVCVCVCICVSVRAQNYVRQSDII